MTPLATYSQWYDEGNSGQINETSEMVPFTVIDLVALFNNVWVAWTGVTSD